MSEGDGNAQNQVWSVRKFTWRFTYIQHCNTTFNTLFCPVLVPMSVCHHYYLSYVQTVLYCASDYYSKNLTCKPISNDIDLLDTTGRFGKIFLWSFTWGVFFISNAWALQNDCGLNWANNRERIIISL
jgi:hypothetical protein